MRDLPKATLEAQRAPFLTDIRPWSTLGCHQELHHQTALRLLLPFRAFLSSTSSNTSHRRKTTTVPKPAAPPSQTHKVGVRHLGHPAQGCSPPGKSVGEQRSRRALPLTRPASSSSRTLLLKPAFVMLSSCSNIKQNCREK